MGNGGLEVRLRLADCGMRMYGDRLVVLRRTPSDSQGQKKSGAPDPQSDELSGLVRSRSIDRQHRSAHAVLDMSRADRKNANHSEMTPSETGTSTQRGN
jgi:hypothetical protein